MLMLLELGKKQIAEPWPLLLQSDSICILHTVNNKQPMFFCFLCTCCFAVTHDCRCCGSLTALLMQDVAWHTKHEHVFGSVGDDKQLIIWDTRQSGTFWVQVLHVMSLQPCQCCYYNAWCVCKHCHVYGFTMHILTVLVPHHPQNTKL